MLSSLINAAIERPTSDTTIRILLDEAANIAPLRELPTLLSQAAGHGLRIATVWQSLAQLEARYGADAGTVLANSTTKLFMGPVTDESTRAYLVGLLGETETDRATNGDPPPQSIPSTRRPAASARDLQQLAGDRAVMIDGAHVPAVVRLTPWWKRTIAASARRGAAPEACGRAHAH